MDELIRKQDALDAFNGNVTISAPRNAGRVYTYIKMVTDRIKALPAVQPNHNAEVSKMVDDLISRQSAQHQITALIDEFETIMKDIRERHVDDSVCGLCEYDGSFISDSGSWCNECPGFERDDCFKLKDQYREEWAGAIKNLPPVQPERIKGHWIEITSINHTYKCSVCGRLLVNITDGKNNVAKNYPYCHCGADMRCSENSNS